MQHKVKESDEHDLVQSDIALIQGLLAKLLHLNDRVEQQFSKFSIIGDGPWNGLNSLPALQADTTHFNC